MVTNSSETLVFPSTIAPVANAEFLTNGTEVRHAMVVIRRMIRSSDKCDEIVQDRLGRAVGTLRATRQAETAFVSQRPADVVFRLASRLLRSLGVRA